MKLYNYAYNIVAYNNYTMLIFLCVQHVKENLGLRHENRKVKGEGNAQPGVEQPRPVVQQPVLLPAQ